MWISGEGGRRGRRPVGVGAGEMADAARGAHDAEVEERERKRAALRREWDEQIAEKLARDSAAKAREDRLDAQDEARRLELEAQFGGIPLGAVRKGVWLGDVGGEHLRGPATPFRKLRGDDEPCQVKNKVLGVVEFEALGCGVWGVGL